MMPQVYVSASAAVRRRCEAVVLGSRDFVVPDVPYSTSDETIAPTRARRQDKKRIRSAAGEARKTIAVSGTEAPAIRESIPR
jgi:hypothetical protein